MAQQEPRRIPLPAAQVAGAADLESLLQARRSVRDYRPGSLSMEEVAQLLWAGQGITRPDGRRTAPSAGALYPLELYLVASQVRGLATGVYHYSPPGHDLEPILREEVLGDLSRAALSQAWIRGAAAVLVIAADYRRTEVKYGERGIRYVHMEAGHVAQNIYLQAGTLGLGTVAVGAFDDERLAEVIGLPANCHALMLLPVGKR